MIKKWPMGPFIKSSRTMIMNKYPPFLALLIALCLMTGPATVSLADEGQFEGLSSDTSGSPLSIEEEAALDQCDAFYNDPAIVSVSSKMVTRQGQIPTKAMMAINEVPSDEEALAIGKLEGAIRQCKEIRAQAGNPTSAMEDIFEARISKLRYGLYKSQIPYAVYNYGVAKAMREQAQFNAEGAQAYSKGKEIGRERAMQMMQHMDTQLQMQLNGFNSYGFGGTWNCTSHVIGSLVSTSCY